MWIIEIMTRIDIILTIVGIFFALIVGVRQIHIAKNVKDFETHQDERDEERRSEQIRTEASRFIQKYNQDGYSSEIYLLPLCVAAYKYNSVYPYRREIYREFCILIEEVQNEILKQFGFDIESKHIDSYYFDALNHIIDTAKIYYKDDINAIDSHYIDDHYFKERGKYFERALTNYGTELIPGDLRCDIDEYEKSCLQSPFALHRDKDGKMNFGDHVTNLLAHPEKEMPLSFLIGDFCSSDEIIASYMCCLIAKYTMFYSYYDKCKSNEEMNLGYVCDYQGARYMEDLFLEALNAAEYYYQPALPKSDE